MFGVNYVIWLLISSMFFALGEFLSKKFATTPSWTYVSLVLLAYSMGVLAWLPAILQKNQLAVVGTMGSVLSLSTTIFIGVVVFGESLSMVNIVGLCLGAFAVFLLSL